MATIQVRHTIGDLARDLAAIPPMAVVDMVDTVRTNAQSGARLAKGFAKQSAGAHGKHYHKAITAEMRTPMSWEYGPDAAMLQGGMSFEFGSRNQKPHLDLARSADIIGPRFAEQVAKLPDRWFW